MLVYDDKVGEFRASMSDLIGVPRDKFYKIGNMIVGCSPNCHHKLRLRRFLYISLYSFIKINGVNTLKLLLTDDPNDPVQAENCFDTRHVTYVFEIISGMGFRDRIGVINTESGQWWFGNCLCWKLRGYTKRIDGVTTLVEQEDSE